MSRFVSQLTGRGKRARSRIGCSLVVGVLVVPLLAACGNGEGSQGNDGGGTLRVAMPLSIVDLDVHADTGRNLITAGRQIFDSLVELQNGEYVGSLAESWESPDSTTWVFKLRDDVKFHDGSQVTADDVVASLERVIEIDSDLAGLWASLETVRASSEYEVTFKTSAPEGSMLANLSFLMVAPADQVDDPDYWRKPIGSGPFKVDEFLPSERLTLSANEDYWDEGPNVPELEFLDIPEPSSRLTALETGEIDLTWSIPPDFVEQVEGIDDVEYKVWPSYTYYFSWFNGSREPFTDDRVREALWHAVDFEDILSNLGGDLASPAKAPIPQSVSGAPQLPPYDYDPERARQLLAEAGYPDGFSSSIQVNSPSGPNLREMASAMVSYWAEIGVDVELQDKERAQWLDDFVALDWDMSMQTNGVLTGDMAYTLGRLYTCDAEATGHCYPELDRMIADARATVDPDERIELWQQVAEFIWDKAIGIFPADLALNTAISTKVSGFEMPPNELPRFNLVEKAS